MIEQRIKCPTCGVFSVYEKPDTPMNDPLKKYCHACGQQMEISCNIVGVMVYYDFEGNRAT